MAYKLAILICVAAVVGLAAAADNSTSVAPAPSTSAPVPAPSSSVPAPATSSAPAPATSSAPAPAPSSSSAPAPAPSSSSAPAPAPSSSSAPAPAPSSSSKPAPSPSPKPSPSPSPKPSEGRKHHLAVMSGDQKCLRLDFDEMMATDGNGNTVNVTDALDKDTAVTGNCYVFVPVNTSYVLQGSMQATLKYNNTQLTVYAIFEQNATYSEPKMSAFVNGSGDRSAALKELAVATQLTVEKKPVMVNSTYTKAIGFNDFAVSYNRSYVCDYTFDYTTNVTSNTNTTAVNATFTVDNVQVQAFLPTGQSNFSLPDDSNNIYCAANSNKEAKVIALIIGGVLAGLAFIGILVFAIGQCGRKKSGYDPIE